MRTLTWLIVAGLLCCFSALPTAHAQAKPDKSQLAAAQNHYKRASAFQDLGEFDKAAGEYLAAYKLYPHAEFLFNVAEVYRLGGQFEKARQYYNKYLTLDPKGRGAAASRIHLVELEKKIAEATRKADAAAKAAARAADKKTPATTTEDPAKSTRVATSDTDSGETAAPTGPVAGVSRSPSRRPGRGLRIAGLSTAAVGIVALGLGMKFGLDASSIASEVEAADPWDQALYERGEAKNRNMFIMYGVGTAALAAGGIMYYLGRKAGQEGAARPRLTVSPVVGGSVTGLVFGGSY